jgi:lathosterol oxidase
VKTLYDWFYLQSPVSWVLFSVLSNLWIALASITGCWLLGYFFRKRTVFAAPQPLIARDIYLAFGCVLLNAGVSIAGWFLWKAGWIHITFPSWPRIVFDTVLLLFYMDAGMYVTHRIVHHPGIFKIVHKTHHTHESMNPISLFVLNPFEVIGFGALLLFALVLFPLSAVAILVYLSLNIVWGTLGHAGVEPFPAKWMRHPLVQQIGTSSFHARHHADLRYNFGFYTTIWDRVFGTLHREK